MEWRRRNRNTFSRGRKSYGRRYADFLPELVNEVLDAVVAHYKESVQITKGGSSKARLERRMRTLRSTLARLEEI